MLHWILLFYIIMDKDNIAWIEDSTFIYWKQEIKWLWGGTNITHHFVISINQPCFVITFLSNTFITCWCFYLFICIFIILFFLFLSLYIFIFALWYINVRGYRRGNQNSAIQRNWQHRVHKTQTNNTKITTPMYWISLYVNKHI